jgi:hypothetical protein
VVGRAAGMSERTLGRLDSPLRRKLRRLRATSPVTDSALLVTSAC